MSEVKVPYQTNDTSGYTLTVPAAPQDTHDRYACPVCFYADLPRPPEDHLICERCGTHFGYDDDAHTHAELRALWMESQRHWRVRALEAMKRDDAIMVLVEDLLAEFKDLAGASEAYVDTTYRQPMLALVGRAARGRGTE